VRGDAQETVRNGTLAREMRQVPGHHVVTADNRVNVAALLLFTTQPTDRALAGWCGTEWMMQEQAEIEREIRQAATRRWT
jgi:hypothetical protein